MLRIKTVLFFLLVSCVSHAQEAGSFFTRQGTVTFFSYTSVENIKAENNQVLSIIDPSKGEIAVSILMRAFVFEKALMEEHFNESYIESDLYPKATFQGNIQDFDASGVGSQTKMISGNLTLHGITKAISIKTNINRVNGVYTFSGELELLVKDFNIRIPPILSPNIAKTIMVKFSFEYDETYEN